MASTGGVCALVRLLFECDAVNAQAAAATALQGLANGAPQIRQAQKERIAWYAVIEVPASRCFDDVMHMDPSFGADHG